jgi:hypothetical protein
VPPDAHRQGIRPSRLPTSPAEPRERHHAAVIDVAGRIVFGYSPSWVAVLSVQASSMRT